MKKALFAVLVMCFVSMNAYAGCKLLACGSFTRFEPNVRITADPSGNQCWGCGLGPNSCDNHDVVPFVDALGDIIELHQCTIKIGGNLLTPNIGDDFFSFEDFEPGVFCDNSQLKAANVANVNLANAKKTYRLKGRATSSTSLGDWDVFQSSAACIYVECNAGFVPNADKTACIVDTRESVCVNSGGTYAGGVCSCDAEKKLKQNAGKTACECVSADYEFIATSKQCEETAASRQRRQQQQQQQQNAIKRKNCEDSGGTWAGGACSCAASKKNLRLESGKCVCVDANYQWDPGSKTCKITDIAALKRACEAATGTYWTGKECKCTQANFWFDGAKCIENPKIVACRSVRGAVWNQLEGKCKCADAKQVLSEGQCVESEDARREREAAEQAAIIVAIKSRIKTASKTLDEIRAGFDVSVWKDKEGKFNTSRLVSDSVAGVVLGTAGGLITSNVVKKNQVENGFEDIQCTVGGQVVANWGDEFRVGIQ